MQYTDHSIKMWTDILPKIFNLPLQKNISENRLENNLTKTLSSKGSIHQPQKKPQKEKKGTLLHPESVQLFF